MPLLSRSRLNPICFMRAPDIPISPKKSWKISSNAIAKVSLGISFVDIMQSKAESNKKFLYFKIIENLELLNRELKSKI